MNKTTLNSQKEKHSMLSLRRATGGEGVAFADKYKFLSTLSLRRATAGARSTKSSFSGFLSTLSLRRATITTTVKITRNKISIHALLAESDARP